MNDKTNFYALAEKHGIEVEYLHGSASRGEARACEVMLDAPNGKIFNASGCHCDGSLSGDFERDGSRTDWRRLFKGLQAIIDAGLEDCPDRENCDMCNPDE